MLTPELDLGSRVTKDCSADDAGFNDIPKIHPSSNVRKARTPSSGRGCHAAPSPPTQRVFSCMRWPTISPTSCGRWLCRVVADEPAGKTREDRRQGRAPWPLRHLPDGRGRGAEGIVPGNPAADRPTTTKTGPSVGTGTVGCIITTGGVCLNDEEKAHIGLSGMVRAATNARSRADAVF